MKHIKAFATQAEVATYEQSQQYIEPYIGASYDSVTAHYNHNTPVYKQFYDYDDETHQYNLYEQVEYIENPSNAYIDTGVLMTNKTRIETILKCNRRLAQMCLFGVCDSKLYSNVYTNGKSNGSTLFAFSMCDVSDGGDWISTTVYSANKLKFIYDTTHTKGTGQDKLGLTIYNMDGILFKYTSAKYYINASPNATFSYSDSPILICTSNPTWGASGGVGVGRFAPISIYSFKIIDTRTNTVNRDFIPVKRINDNVYGLWDRANSKFYVSPNGTQFTGGAKMIYDTNDVQYQQVEYISNPSTAYIDTGFKPNQNTKINAQFSVNTFDATYGQFLFGARSSTTTNKFYCIIPNNTQYMQWHFNTANASNTSVNFSLNEKWTISNNKNVLTYTNGINTYTLTPTNSNFSCPHNILIFALNNNGTAAGGVNCFKGKYYYFKIYNNLELVRDFIPVKRVSDSKYGLFDCVNKQFYTSQTDVDFTGG